MTSTKDERNKRPLNELETETQLVLLGNNPAQQFGFVSPPIYRGSTALYDDVEGLKASMNDPFKRSSPSYGRLGTPNTRSLEDALSALEEGFCTVLTNSGLSAITTSILSLVESNDHILMVDSVYWPTRHFCDSLRRFGIETEYYDPRIGADIRKLIRTNTRIVYMESPGSLTFEVQDVPAIVEACKPQQIYTLIDNTWATPLYFQPLKLGVDISIHSGTKYFGGHSDCFIGAAICNDRAYGKVRTQAINLGQCPGPEDVFLALRGLRTLAVRLEHHQKQALNLAHWLEGQSEVAEVLYPALPSSVDHALWKRDYSGASGLLGFLLKPGYSIQQAEQMINQLQLFGLGASWGGFESLVIGSDPTSYRSKVSWNKPGALIRLHIGFENILDLQSDLARAFECLKGN